MSWCYVALRRSATILQRHCRDTSSPMKALVKHASGVGNVDILDVDEPSCGADQVKVEVAFCGVCGTDIHVMNDTFRNYPPVILGHEFAGKVVEKGVKVTDVKLGES